MSLIARTGKAAAVDNGTNDNVRKGHVFAPKFC